MRRLYHVLLHSTSAHFSHRHFSFCFWFFCRFILFFVRLNRHESEINFPPANVMSTTLWTSKFSKFVQKVAKARKSAHSYNFKILKSCPWGSGERPSKLFTYSNMEMILVILLRRDSKPNLFDHTFFKTLSQPLLPIVYFSYALARNKILYENYPLTT